MKINGILKNLSYSFSVNFISLIISVLMVALLPKVMGVEDYGAWQLYLFYLSYVGFFPFGWIDGIYLRYGGKTYEELDKKIFSGQFYALAILESIIAMCFILYAKISVQDVYVSTVIQFISIVGVFTVLVAFTSFIMQFTNRIKDYAKLVLYERVLFFICVLVYIKLGFIGYKGLLAISLATKLGMLFFSCYLIKEVVQSNVGRLGDVFSEMRANIIVGSKLMFANIAGMLLIGIVRFGISQGWNIAIFGKVSLTLSVSNFLMVFISAISVVLFPILKRINQDNLPKLYIVLRNCLTVPLLGMLLFYYPLKVLLSMWLPKYADSLIYMAILFPVCLFESKVSLLINTYLKSLRQELLMLRINCIAVIISGLLTFIGVIILNNLNITILSIILIFAFRCILAEYFLGKLLEIELCKDIVLEILMVVLFISTGWILDSWLSLVIYGAGYTVYLIIKKNDIIESIKTIKAQLAK